MESTRWKEVTFPFLLLVLILPHVHVVVMAYALPAAAGQKVNEAKAAFRLKWCQQKYESLCKLAHHEESFRTVASEKGKMVPFAVLVEEMF